MLDRQKYLVKEHVGMFKLSDTYDIFDAETKQKIGVAREEIPAWAKWLRLLVNKKLLPTTVALREGEDLDGEIVLSIVRGVGLFRVPVKVFLGDKKIGEFKSKIFSLGGGFYVYDAHGNQVAEVKGDWKGWDFRLVTSEGRLWAIG